MLNYFNIPTLVLFINTVVYKLWVVYFQTCFIVLFLCYQRAKLLICHLESMFQCVYHITTSLSFLNIDTFSIQTRFTVYIFPFPGAMAGLAFGMLIVGCVLAAVILFLIGRRQTGEQNDQLNLELVESTGS